LNISARYNDGGGDRSGLVLLINSQTTSSNTSSFLGLYGYNSAIGGAGAAGNTYFSNVYDVSGSASTSNTFGSIEVIIRNYASSTNKPINFVGMSENNSTTNALTGIQAGQFRDTTAITTLKIECIGGISNFAAYSSFHLYGIKRA
jgi:hypothetical protein